MPTSSVWMPVLVVKASMILRWAPIRSGWESSVHTVRRPSLTPRGALGSPPSPHAARARQVTLAVIAAVILLTSLCGVIATPSLVGVGSGPASLKHR